MKDKRGSLLPLDAKPDLLLLSNLQVLVLDDPDEVVNLRPGVKLQQDGPLPLTGEFGRLEVHLLLDEFVAEGVWQPRLGCGAGPASRTSSSQLAHGPGGCSADGLRPDRGARVGGGHHGGDVLHRHLQTRERLRLEKRKIFLFQEEIL